VNYGMSIFNLVSEVVRMPSNRGKKEKKTNQKKTNPKKRSKKNKNKPDNDGGGGIVSTFVNAVTKLMPSRSR
jgi:hypothetical protein